MQQLVHEQYLKSLRHLYKEKMCMYFIDTGVSLFALTWDFCWEAALIFIFIYYIYLMQILFKYKNSNAFKEIFHCDNEDLLENCSYQDEIGPLNPGHLRDLYFIVTIVSVPFHHLLNEIEEFALSTIVTVINQFSLN